MIRRPQQYSSAVTFVSALIYCLLIVEGSFKVYLENRFIENSAFWTSFLPINLFPSEVLLYFIGIPVSLLLLPWVLQQRATTEWTALSALYFVYSVYCLRNGMGNGAGNNAFTYFKAFYFKIFLLPLFVALAIKTEKREMMKTVWGFSSAFSIYVSVYGLLMITEGNIANKDPLSANFTGLQLLLLPMLYGFYEYYVTGKSRWALGSALIAVAVVIPLEKPAISSLAVGVVCAWSLFIFNQALQAAPSSGGKSAVRFVLGASVILVLGLVVAYSVLNISGGNEWVEYIEQRFLKVGLKNDDISSGRFDMWAWAFNMWLSSPIVGHGIGVLYHGQESAVGVHNMYLEVLYTTGLAGFLMYMLWTFSPIMKLYVRLKIQAYSHDSFSFPLLVWLCTMLFSNLFGNTTSVQSMSSAYFMMMAFAAYQSSSPAGFRR